jgi:hypothetical protein
VTHIGSLAVHRIAGLPGGFLSLSHDVSDSLLESIHAATIEQATSAATLSDEIHALVPTIEKPTRNALLRARRLIHNGKLLDPEDLRLLELLDSDAVDKFSGATRQLQARLHDLENAIHADAARSHGLINAAIHHEAMSGALTLLAPEFLAAIARKGFQPHSKLLRTALYYIIRAAMKPSPLSSLTGVQVEGVELAARSAQVPVSLAFAALRAAAVHPAYMWELDSIPSPVWSDGTRTYVIVQDSSAVDGEYPWIVEESVDVEAVAADLASAGPWAGGRLDELRDSLYVDDAELRVRRLLKTGLIRPVIPWTNNSNPIEALHLLLSAASRRESDGLDRCLLSILDAERTLAAADVGDRAMVLVHLREAVNELFDILGAPVPAGRYINEDTSVSQSRFVAADMHHAHISALADSLRPSFFRSHVYDALVEAFVARFGVGGTAPDASRFLMECDKTPEFASALFAAKLGDSKWLPDVHGDSRSSLPVGATSAPPTAAIMYQAAEDSGDQSGIVLNQISSGTGGLVARFSSLDESGAFGSEIRKWIDECYPQVEEKWAFIPSSSVSALQRAGTDVLPEMQFLSSENEARSFQALTLVHDPALDILDFQTEDGRRIAPVHLGIVPAWMSKGPVGLALTLIDPWVDGSALTRSSHPARRLANASAAARNVPRLCVDGVVLHRETWTVPVAELPFETLSESPTAFLVRLDEWRRNAGLPAEVFVWIIGSNSVDGNIRKPLWMNFHSLVTVESVLHLARGQSFLRFQEVLPARRQDYSLDSIPESHVREIVRFVRWDRPDAPAPAEEQR